MLYLRIIVSHTPIWVYGVFALLLYLGLRRLRERRSTLRRALLAPAVFTLWSFSSVIVTLANSRDPAVAAVWAGCLALGALSRPLRFGGPPPTALADGRFVMAATVVPLIAYLLLFWARFGLEVWAGFQPERAAMIAYAIVALSAFTAGRTLADFAAMLRSRRAVVA